MTHFSSYAQFIKYAFVSIMSHVPPSTTYRIYTYACRVLRQKFFKVLPIGVSESYSHANYETEPTDNCNRWQTSEQDIYVVVTQEQTYMLIWPLIRLLKLHHLGHLNFQVLMQTQPGWHTCKCSIYETQINLWQHRLRFRPHHHHHHHHYLCCRWLPLTTLDNT